MLPHKIIILNYGYNIFSRLASLKIACRAEDSQIFLLTLPKWM